MVRTLFVAAAAASLACASAFEGERLFEFEGEVRKWMTEKEIEAFHEQRDVRGLGFMDVTDVENQVEHPAHAVKSAQHQKATFPTAPRQQELVNSMIGDLSATEMEDFLTAFSQWNDRYYTSDTGVISMEWMGEKMNEMAGIYNYNNLNVTYFEHSGYPQTSPIGRIVGSEFPEEIIIVSAHSDSVRNSPGADDDGSGCANFVEVLRVLMKNDYQPRRTIEFIGWAAEEVGLRGSNEIAQNYADNNKNVIAVYQNEMSGYEGGAANRQIILLQDFVDNDLQDFNEALVNEYCDIPAKRSICGYGCSDHASWTNRGFSATCTAEAGPFDAGLNPHYHTAQDTVDKLDFGYSLEFAKLGLSFVLELDQM
jgi:leucyl aminopeptidase